MRSSLARPRVRVRTAATVLALLGILLAGLLVGGTGASARPTHPTHPSHSKRAVTQASPVYSHGNGRSKTQQKDQSRSTVGVLALAAPLAAPKTPNGTGQGGGLIGRVLGGLIGAVNTVGAAVPAVINDTVQVVNNTTGILTGHSSAPAPTPTQGRPPVPPTSAAPQPPVATTPASARSHSRRPAVQPVAAGSGNGTGPGSNPATAASTSAAPARHHSALDDLLHNPAALLSAPGTAVLIGMILVFLGGVVAVVFSAGYRGRRAH